MSLCRKKLIFLRHQLSAKGIEPDPARLSAIGYWPPSQNTKKLPIFLGLCNHYSEFIPNLGQRTLVLNQLTGRSKFIWSFKRDAAFSDLKFALTSGEVLFQFPGMLKPFELSTDASDTGISCVLSQRDDSGRDQPVLFASKALADNELNWHTRDIEAYTFIFVLRKFRLYLLGRRFTWYTDHKDLRWWRHSRDPRGRHARWLQETEEFNFVIKHRPGCTKLHADAPSRTPMVNTLSQDGLNLVPRALGTRLKMACSHLLNLKRYSSQTSCWGFSLMPCNVVTNFSQILILHFAAGLPKDNFPFLAKRMVC